MSKCKFDNAWEGNCNKETDHEYCEEHSKLKCEICGKQATHTCPVTMQLICGALLCDDPKCKEQHDFHQHTRY